MAESPDRARLEEIIREELSNLDEGFLDRVLAKAKGNVKGLNTVGQNLKKVGVAVAKGGDLNQILKNPGVERGIEIAASRVGGFQKKLSKVSVDLMSDMESMFGEGLKDAPEGIKKELLEWGEDVKALLTDTSDLAKRLKSRETWTGQAQAGGGDPGTAPEPEDIAQEPGKRVSEYRKRKMQREGKK